MLVLGGALKFVDPSGSVGALRALGVTVASGVVRVAAGAEAVLGAVALALGGTAVAALLAASYAGFAAVAVIALARGVPVDTCGCLGRLETPPSWRHVVVTGVVALAGAHQALDPSDALLERLDADPGAGAWFTLGAVALAAIGVWALRAGRRPSVPR